MAANQCSHYTLSRGQICLNLSLAKTKEVPGQTTVSKIVETTSTNNYKEFESSPNRDIDLSCNELDQDLDSENETSVETNSKFREFDDNLGDDYVEDLDDDLKDLDWVPRKKKHKGDNDQMDISDEDRSDLEGDETQDISNSDRNDSETEKESTKMNKRKKKADPSQWKRNKSKTLRMLGKGYEGVKKKADGKYVQEVTKPPRHMGPGCNAKKCSKAVSVCKCKEFTDDERQSIFNDFWNMDWDQKKVYVRSMIDSTEPKERSEDKNPSRRKQSLKYHLKRIECRVRVCKAMFLSTLGMGEWTVLGWIRSCSSAGMSPSSSASVTPPKPSNEKKKDAVSNFLQSLATLPSHYCRASTSKLYLEPGIQSVSQLHRIYEEQVASTDSSKHVSITLFREVVDENNIAIFQPKKDQCDVCCSYESGNIEEDVYNEHIQKKTQARAEKTKDKQEALSGDGKVITLDLQAVLLAPCLKASAMYYKTKLACHNFTVFDLATSEVVCYFWHEGEGELGANSFASCVYDYVTNEMQDTDKLTIFSDGCTYQNRNSTLANTLLHLSITKGMTITQKFLEKGHTQMECDSIHSTIERALRNRPIYCPANYVQYIEGARVKNPYKVKYLSHTFFRNFSTLSYYNSIRPGTKVGDRCVTDLRVIKYTPNGQIQYKLLYDEDLQDLPRKARTSDCRNYTDQDIQPLYDSKVRITKRKFQHLQELKKVIPSDYHGFYDNLPHSDK